MALIKSVERQMWDREGFEVAVRHPNGRDVRSDKTAIPGYRYSKAAKNDWTVAEWKRRRFGKEYPGFNAAVHFSDGSEAPGNTKLWTVRHTYRAEEYGFVIRGVWRQARHSAAVSTGVHLQGQAAGCGD